MSAEISRSDRPEDQEDKAGQSPESQLLAPFLRLLADTILLTGVQRRKLKDAVNKAKGIFHSDPLGKT